MIRISFITIFYILPSLTMTPQSTFTRSEYPAYCASNFCSLDVYTPATEWSSDSERLALYYSCLDRPALSAIALSIANDPYRMLGSQDRPRSNIFSCSQCDRQFCTKTDLNLHTYFDHLSLNKTSEQTYKATTIIPSTSTTDVLSIQSPLSCRSTSSSSFQVPLLSSRSTTSTQSFSASPIGTPAGSISGVTRSLSSSSVDSTVDGASSLSSARTDNVSSSISTNIRLIDCPLCSEILLIDEIARHIQKRHATEINHQEWQCPLKNRNNSSKPCGKVCKGKSGPVNLQYHIASVHFGKKPYECNNCGSGWHVKKDFKDHECSNNKNITGASSIPSASAARSPSIPAVENSPSRLLPAAAQTPITPITPPSTPVISPTVSSSLSHQDYRDAIILKYSTGRPAVYEHPGTGAGATSSSLRSPLLDATAAPSSGDAQTHDVLRALAPTAASASTLSTVPVAPVPVSRSIRSREVPAVSRSATISSASALGLNRCSASTDNNCFERSLSSSRSSISSQSLTGAATSTAVITPGSSDMYTGIIAPSSSSAGATSTLSKTHHKIISCPICSVTAPENKIAYHIREHAKDIESELSCPLKSVRDPRTACTSGFTGSERKSNLVRHINWAHLHITQHICKICGSRYRDNYALEMHKCKTRPVIQSTATETTIDSADLKRQSSLNNLVLPVASSSTTLLAEPTTSELSVEEMYESLAQTSGKKSLSSQNATGKRKRDSNSTDNADDDDESITNNHEVSTSNLVVSQTIDTSKEDKCPICFKLLLRNKFPYHVQTKHATSSSRGLHCPLFVPGLGVPCDVVCRNNRENGPRNLRQHIKTVHLGIKKYSCPLCGAVLEDKATLDRYHRCTNRKKLKDTRATTSSSLVSDKILDSFSAPSSRHESTVLTPTNNINAITHVPYQCDSHEICDSYQDSTSDTSTIVPRSSTSNIYACQIPDCDRSFDRSFDLVSHLTDHHKMTLKEAFEQTDIIRQKHEDELKARMAVLAALISKER